MVNEITYREIDTTIRGDASPQVKGFLYQFLVALQFCLEMKSNQALYIEKFGDFAIKTAGEGESISAESKHYSTTKIHLLHNNVINTLYNWAQPNFHQEHYSKLLLITTQDVREGDALNLIIKTDNEIKGLKKIIEELRNNRSLEEQGYKKMLEMEGLLDAVINIQKSGLDDKIATKKAELSNIETEFNKRYRIKAKMESASKSINNFLEVYRKDLSFEPSLDDYKLKFNLDNFELAFEKGEEKLRLRQIESGRNWLNAHLCLFLSLSYFFAVNKTLIHSLLFIDQPSQVYFPTKDNYENFSAEKMWERKEGTALDTDEEKNKLNQDLEEVTNIFNTLYKFTQSVNSKVQIIVTEHADNLNLDGVEFNELVAARRRKENEGLIMDREL